MKQRKKRRTSPRMSPESKSKILNERELVAWHLRNSVSPEKHFKAASECGITLLNVIKDTNALFSGIIRCGRDSSVFFSCLKRFDRKVKLHYTSEEDEEIWQNEVIHLYRRWLASLRMRRHKLDDIDVVNLDISEIFDIMQEMSICPTPECASKLLRLGVDGDDYLTLHNDRWTKSVQCPLKLHPLTSPQTDLKYARAILSQGMNDLPVIFDEDTNITFLNFFSAWTTTNETKQNLVNLLLDYGYTSVIDKAQPGARNPGFVFKAIQTYRSYEQKRCKLVVQLLHEANRRQRFPLVLCENILSFYSNIYDFGSI